MTRIRTFLLVAVSLTLLSQIPFAYRRYRLGRLNARIQLINSAHRTSDLPDNFAEYQGVMHVHSFLGGHSTGRFQDIIAAAQANKVQFVVMTEHAQSVIDTSAMTLKGTHGGVLFVNGNEINTANGDRLLAIPGDVSLSGSDKIATSDIVSATRSRGGLIVIAYPEEFKSWGNTYDGLEIYNVFTNFRRVSLPVAFFDALWSHHTYPDLLFANYYRRPDTALRKWDEILAHSKIVATAGNDSHANIGVSLNDSSGNRLVGLQLDPYQTSFHLVRIHVLLPRAKTFDESSLLEAIRAGHSYVGFDLFGDTSGFRFEAFSPRTNVIQGDEIPLENETRLRVTVPVPSRVLLLKNGEPVLDESGLMNRELAITERGVYRVEIYLPQLGMPVAEQPWIISNPIYVR